MAVSLRIKEPAVKQATRLMIQNQKLKDAREQAMQKVKMEKEKAKAQSDALKAKQEALKQKDAELKKQKQLHKDELKKAKEEFRNFRRRWPDHALTKNFRAIAALADKNVAENEMQQLLERFGV